MSLIHFVALYRLRVPVKTGQMLGAMITAMSVQWTVSRAVAQGLITEHLAFARTSKGGFSIMSVEFQAFWEAVIGVLLLVGAGVLIVTNSYKEVREIYVFAAVLVLESLPFLSAVAIAILENSRINAFSFWTQHAGADRRTDRAAPGGDAGSADRDQRFAAGGLGNSPGGQLKPADCAWTAGRGIRAKDMRHRANPFSAGAFGVSRAIDPQDPPPTQRGE